MPKKRNKKSGGGGSGQKPPSLETTITDQTVKSGREVTLTCKFHLGNPPATITWQKSREEVVENDRITSSHDAGLTTLTIRSTTPSDAGTYKCVASNSAGSVYCVGNIAVEQQEGHRPVEDGDGEAERDAALSSAEEFSATQSKLAFSDEPPYAPKSQGKTDSLGGKQPDSATVEEVSLIDLTEENIPVETDKLSKSLSSSASPSYLMSDGTQSFMDEDPALPLAPEPSQTLEAAVGKSKDLGNLIDFSDEEVIVTAQNLSDGSWTIMEPETVQEQSAMVDSKCPQPECEHVQNAANTSDVKEDEGNFSVSNGRQDKEMKFWDDAAATETITENVKLNGEVTVSNVHKVDPSNVNESRETIDGTTFAHLEQSFMVVPELQLGGIMMSNGDIPGDPQGSKPVLKRPLTDQAVTLGEKVTLECSFEIRGNWAKVKWTKDNEEILGDDHMQISQTSELLTLTIPCCKKEDSGSYYCEVSNELGSASTGASLVVLDIKDIPQTDESEDGVFLLPVSNESKDGASLVSVSDMSTEQSHTTVTSQTVFETEMSLIDLNLEPVPAATLHQDKLTHESESFQSGVMVTETNVQNGASAYADVGPELNNVKSAEIKDIISQETWTHKPAYEKLDLQDESKYPTSSVTEESDDHVIHCLLMAAVEAAVARADDVTRPEVKEALQDAVMVAGASAELTCSFTNLDDHSSIHWFKDHRFVKPDARHLISVGEKHSTLNVLTVGPEDCGLYMCTATNKAGSVSTHCKLHLQDVAGASSGDECTPETSILGESVTLRAAIPAGLNPDTVQWIKDGEDISLSGRCHVSTDGSYSVLTIPAAAEADLGLYRCVPTGYEINLRPRDGKRPEVEQPLTNTAVYPGRDVQLCCVFCNIHSSSHFQWFKDSVAIVDSSRYTTNSTEGVCTLTIHKASTDDIGVYECKATNLPGSISTICQLTLIREQKTGHSNPLQTHSGIRGRRVVLKYPCGFADRARRVRWFKDGQEIESSKRIQKYTKGSTAYLIIHSASEGDHGVYACQPGNARVRLIRHSDMAPRVDQPLRDITVCETIPAWLICHFSNTSHDVKITWEKDGEPIRDSSNCDISYTNGTAKLLLRNVVRADAGSYRCVASGRYGNANTSCQVHLLEEKPSNDYVRILAQTLLTKRTVTKMNLPDRVTSETDMLLVLGLLAANFPGLQQLYINDNELRLNTAIIKKLGQLPELTHLRLDGNHLNDPAIYTLELVLRYLPNLEVFGMSRCISRLSDESCVERLMESLARYCPQLRGLDIRDNGLRVREAMGLIKPLVHCRKLQKLLLLGNKFTEEGLARLKTIVEDMPVLEDLGLY